MRRRSHSGNSARYSAKSRFSQKYWWMRTAERFGPRLKNRIPVIKQIRAFKARRHAFKRRIVGNIARAATLGYIKPLSHKKLKPCKGVRKALRRTYFAFKKVKNWKRGGNRSKDYRSKKVAKSRFTVLNCK